MNGLLASLHGTLRLAIFPWLLHPRMVVPGQGARGEAIVCHIARTCKTISKENPCQHSQTCPGLDSAQIRQKHDEKGAFAAV